MRVCRSVLVAVLTLYMSSSAASSELALQDVFDGIVQWSNEALESYSMRATAKLEDLKDQLVGKRIRVDDVSVNASGLSYDSNDDVTRYDAGLMLTDCDYLSASQVSGIYLDTASVEKFCMTDDLEKGLCWDFTLTIETDGDSMIMGLVGTKNIEIYGVLASIVFETEGRGLDDCEGASGLVSDTVSIKVGISVESWRVADNPPNSRLRKEESVTIDGNIETIDKLATIADCDPEARTITVPGSHIWTETSLLVLEGDALSFEAGGNVSPDGLEWTDPGGSPDRHWNKEYNMYNVINHAGLMGKIGKGGKVFPIGSLAQIQAEERGALYLGVNDKEPHNNKGEFDVDVTICR